MHVHIPGFTKTKCCISDTVLPNQNFYKLELLGKSFQNELQVIFHDFLHSSAKNMQHKHYTLNQRGKLK